MQPRLPAWLSSGCFTTGGLRGNATARWRLHDSITRSPAGVAASYGLCLSAGSDPSTGMRRLAHAILLGDLLHPHRRSHSSTHRAGIPRDPVGRRLPRHVDHAGVIPLLFMPGDRVRWYDLPVTHPKRVFAVAIPVH